MKINESSLKDLEKIGVYKITNLINSKVYVGSTRKSFVSRYSSHYEKLRTNNHKGYQHLQNAVNKYSIENFEFSILEICEKDKCIERETFWISDYNACNREKGYNTNDKPFLSPFANKEIRAKAAKTVSERYKSGLILPNKGTFKNGLEPWNKGKTYQSTNHLKVPKKIKGDRTKFSINALNKLPRIQVTNNESFIKDYNNYYDIINDTELWKFMKLRNKNGRQGYSPYYLLCSNIQKACITGKSYKGLNFTTISSL